MRIIENVKRGAGELLDQLAEGWRRLAQRSGAALTRFTQPEREAGVTLLHENWGLLSSTLRETPKEVVVEVEIPGLDEEDFDITVSDRHLVLRGRKSQEREEEGSTYHLHETVYGAFERVFELPAEVDGDHAKATYRRGVLTVRLPKRHAQSVRHIKIRS